MSPPTLRRLARLSLVPGICIALALVAGAYANKDKEANTPSVAAQDADTGKQLFDVNPSLTPTIGPALGTRLAAPRADGNGSGSPAAAGVCASCNTGVDGQIGIQGGFFQVCGDDQWTGLAFPIVTGGGEFDTVTLQLNTNLAGGDLYIMGDINCQPDITNILALSCCALDPLPVGVPAEVHLTPFLTSADSPTWVVFVGRTGLAGLDANGDFDGSVFPSHSVARDTLSPSLPNQAFANLVGTGNPGDWSDLNDFAFGNCYAVGLSSTGLDPDIVDCADHQGACCFPGGVCEDATHDFLCLPADGGTYAGDGVDCANAKCEPPPAACGKGAGPCNESNGSPGCEDALCCALVCVQLPACCDVDWDQSCADEAIALGCASIPIPPECVNADGPCDVLHGTPGCEDELCCALVCAADPFCCAVDWNQGCVDLALQICDLPCSLKSPPGALDEGEDCGSDTNGGCNSDPPVYTNAVCGDVFAGNAWADGGTRDTDWYVVEHGGGILSATLTSQFQGVCFILSGPPSDCGVVVVEGDIGCSSDCANVAVASADLPAGTYVVFVATGNCDGSGIFDGVPCGGSNNYVLEINCKGPPPDPCPADLDGPDGVPGAPVSDGVVGVHDLLFLIGVWGDCPLNGAGDCPADLDGPDGVPGAPVPDGVVGVHDLLFLIGVWGDCPV